jgi:hypothetical protein
VRSVAAAAAVWPISTSPRARWESTHDQSLLGRNSRTLVRSSRGWHPSHEPRSLGLRLAYCEVGAALDVHR